MTHHDAGPVRIRRLWPSDRAAVEAHFARLDRETRFNRFMGAVSPEGARAYGAAALGRAGLVYGAFVGGELRGVGEIRPAGSGGLGPEGEAALTVEAAYRRRGIGTALARRLCAAARHARVERLHLRTLAGNRALLALARRLGAELAVAGHEAHALLRVAPPTPLSAWAEYLDGIVEVVLAAVEARPARA
ncbi:GNAT family N-acetyltransferase [Methylobacterium nodulans]|uniref:GCN5-related N-acetyltransferase n=1 Tax=Methylobacterium nodulans (strain LMG 21967 / CNCM I-2342 / ORS 2060) TaxID=460265 RepID=B8IJB1_METNO|nr:GNAT family N-acetyltransferase [Methylobacterium nodulans]ACL56126.1 GCN5-related N-acetyltransferase [Methylobacterium nodulans ORS 2060]